MASLLNRDTPITAISAINTSAMRTYRTRIEIRGGFLSNTPQKAPSYVFSRCAVFRIVVDDVGWLAKQETTYLPPSCAIVLATINTAAFLQAKSRFTAAARHNLHFAHFCFDVAFSPSLLLSFSPSHSYPYHIVFFLS